MCESSLTLGCLTEYTCATSALSCAHCSTAALWDFAIAGRCDIAAQEVRSCSFKNLDSQSRTCASWRHARGAACCAPLCRKSVHRRWPTRGGKQSSILNNAHRGIGQSSHKKSQPGQCLKALPSPAIATDQLNLTHTNRGYGNQLQAQQNLVGQNRDM